MCLSIRLKIYKIGPRGPVKYITHQECSYEFKYCVKWYFILLTLTTPNKAVSGATALRWSRDMPIYTDKDLFSGENQHALHRTTIFGSIKPEPELEVRELP